MLKGNHSKRSGIVDGEVNLSKGDGVEPKGHWMSRLGLRTLRSKITAVFLIVAILPLFALSYFSIDKSREVLERDSVAFATDVAVQVGTTIDAEIVGVANQIVTLSTSSGLADVNDTYRELLEITKQSNPDYLAVYVAKPDKSMVLNKSSDEPLPDGYDPTARDWYVDAVGKKGAIAVGVPYVDAANGDLVITVSRAVMSGDNVLGVVAVDLNIDRMVSKIEEIQIGESGYVYVVSKDGDIVLHKDADMIGKSMKDNVDLWKGLESKGSGFTTDGDYHYSFAKSKFSGWGIVSVLDDRELDESGDEVRNISLWIILGVVLLIVAVSYILGKAIATNINELLRVMGKASSGDLTERAVVPSADEFKLLADGLNGTLDNLTVVLRSVEDSSARVTGTSETLSEMTEETRQSVEQVTHAVGEVAEGTMVQTQSVSTGVEEMQMLSGRLDEMNVSADRMVHVSEESSKLSRDGLAKVSVLSDRSEKTREATDRVAVIVDEVSDSMEKINVILTTITGITEQTNLLALNAAIEAARAGEQGRGFAVVASEVRKLAEQSKDSTVEIRDIVGNIKKVVHSAVDSMDEVKGSVDEQVVAVDETREIFNRLLGSVEDLADRVNEVRDSIGEIDRGRGSVVTEMDNISKVSSHNAAASEEVYASTEEITARMSEFSEYASELAELARGLDAEVSKFKINH